MRMGSASTVRVGIVGCGSVMQGPYMSQLDRLRGRGLVEVVVACDRNESRRHLIIDEFGIKRFTMQSDEVTDADDVDLVLVLTSVADHGDLAERALAHGKHVLVEKPMAVDLGQAAALVDLAKAYPGYLVCAPFVVLSHTYGVIWRRVRNGEIGRVLSARARYGWAGPTWNEWFYAKGGGALVDLALYNLTALTGLLGPVRRVTGFTGIAIPERQSNEMTMHVEAEDNAQLLLDFGDATLASVTAGFTMQQSRSPAIELYGTHGTLQMLGDDWAPQGFDQWGADVGHWRHYKDLDPAWLWTDGLRHAVECIRTATPPLTTPEHARHVLEVVEKARQASSTGLAQTVDSTFPQLDLSDDASDEPVHQIHNLRV